MKTLFTSLLLLSLFILTGCNGSSGKNEEVVTGADIVVSNLTLTILNQELESQQSFESNAPITLQAKVLDQNGDAVSGKRVNFTIDLGSLSVPSKLTDSSGIAEVSISNNLASLSAGTASATIDDLSASIDYEYISSSSEVISSASLSIKMLVNGALTNRFKADESAQIVATLLDENGDPFSNQLINISADVGELTSTTALTTVSGNASFSITGGTSLGAGVITLSLAGDTSVNSHLNYEIVSADATIKDNVRLGYFNDSNEFIEGEIKLSIDDNTISAGGTLGVSVVLVDSENQRVNTPTAVSFTSNCVSNENAVIDTTVFSIKGSASATYEDIKCAGINGTEDVIVATVTTNGITSTASETIDITGEQLGSIEFLSAVPNSIVLKGSGGQETSILTFVVKSALGNVVAQQEVNFTLDTIVGGISLGRVSGLTNSQGQITTQVLSGTVPTTASVTAKATRIIDGEEVSIQTQSKELSINTGLAEQSSITIAPSIINPEASTTGETSQISVWLADSFNNPVPDGTPANFTTEGGTIESQCLTVNGTCSVEWRATEPYLDDHRSTILVTADGHETFYDTNGNNTFDDDDGLAITDPNVSSGLGRRAPEASGFIDMSEAWRDDNENGVKDDNETKFFDADGDGDFSDADKIFNGPQCEGSLCNSSAKIATIRKAFVLIMSDANNPIYELTGNGQTYASNSQADVQIEAIADGESRSFNFKFADSAMQTLPKDSVISVQFSGGTINGTTSYTVGNTRSAGFKAIDFILKNELDGEPELATLSITISTPGTGNKIYFSQLISML
ncbi:Ig-like domain-containing protein [Colwellia sp. UCD-KL20]|uniref:Ig-like domain-containing protein n=1 Tax=Colwellia sp. UCD-KL20 TaxID=1917165 RepID=UPI0009713D53|nr:Ig-like domain-containing protein [Colwellia sp. UCD-KL20]